MAREFLSVDPGALRLPSSRIDGADPPKLQRQIAKYGRSSSGMPDILVYRGSDGELMISDGVTRATRMAKLAPGTRVPIEVIGTLRHPFAQLPTVLEKLP